MSYVLAALGFMILIVLHELGHFTAAKLVGMRVERFSLFFPPLLVRKKIGETEYAVGAIPLGGYVKISGMSPAEDLPDEATFPCLRLAREAAAAGGTAPCVLNAANEVAVQAFLDGEIPFTAIAEVIERSLDAHEPRPIHHFNVLYGADAEAREMAREFVGGVRA